MTKCRLLLAFPLVLGIIAGCNKGNPNAPASVSGKVTYKDKTLTAGMVTFFTPEGTPYNCPIKADGTYSGTDMPAGDLTVTVETESANTSKKVPQYGGKDRAGGASPAPQDRNTEAGEYVKIPKKYGDKKTSSLTANLTKGKNTKNFELTD
jgi:hypothetical protein